MRVRTRLTAFIVGVIMFLVILAILKRQGEIQLNVLIPDSLYIAPATFTRVVSGPDFWRHFSTLLLNSSSGKVISKNNGELEVTIGGHNYRVYVHEQNQFNFSILVTKQADTLYTGNLRYSILRPFVVSLTFTKHFNFFTDPSASLCWYNLFKAPAPSGFLEKAYLYLTSPASIYGYKITRAKVTDTLLLSTRDTVGKTRIWPSLKIRSDLLLKRAMALSLNPSKSSPIFHLDSVAGKPEKKVLFVGINIKRRPTKKENLFTEMPTGNVLYLDFKGGRAEETKAQKAMGLYISERQMQQPFLTWQRFLNFAVPPPIADSNRWKRRLYSPVL